MALSPSLTLSLPISLSLHTSDRPPQARCTLSPHSRLFLKPNSYGTRDSFKSHKPASSVRASQGDTDGEHKGNGSLFLGLDFGTSGARAMVVDMEGSVQADARRTYPEDASQDWAAAWESTLDQLLLALPLDIRARLSGIAIDGTSATTMIVRREDGHPLAPPLLYNEGCPEVLKMVKEMAPPNHTVATPTSTLCKLLSWVQKQENEKKAIERAMLQHQADWLAFLLHGKLGVSDYNNALKVGFDPGTGSYPSWLSRHIVASMLPNPVPPGEIVENISQNTSEKYGVPENCKICAGTTDSIAAFLAADVANLGDAVTSLGSTLAVKMVSEIRVDDARYGVYSHWLGENQWLVGGASNVGGAVLRKLFSDSQLRDLSEKIDPRKSSPLDYYPLLKPGERFPVADPHLQPRLEPRPASDVEFLHGLLESMARVEGKAYALLKELGASPLQRVFTAGGGASNDKWTAMRARILQVPVEKSAQTEAAYGAALLARKGFLA